MPFHSQSRVILHVTIIGILEKKKSNKKKKKTLGQQYLHICSLTLLPLFKVLCSLFPVYLRCLVRSTNCTGTGFDFIWSFFQLWKTGLVKLTGFPGHQSSFTQYLLPCVFEIMAWILFEFHAQQTVPTYFIQLGLLVQEKIPPQWKCEIKRLFLLQITAFDLPRRTNFLIYCFVCLFFYGIHLCIVSSFFSQQNSKYGEREMEYIFAIFDGGCFIMSSSQEKLSKKVYCCLSEIEK